MSFYKAAIFRSMEYLGGFVLPTGEPPRFAELKIHVKQDADRRIPPGRDPGSGGAW